jgi:hypothetical protein
MSKAACAKEIINNDTKGAMATFHRFVELGLVEARDFLDVAKAERASLDIVRKVNQRIADRQPEK